MEYTDEKAQEIFGRYQGTENAISETTLKVWKSRGKIPNKYNSPDWKPRRVPTTRQEKAEIARIKAVAQSPKISVEVLTQLAKVPRQAFFDSIRPNNKGAELDYNYGIALKKEINRLRISVKAWVELVQNKQRYSDPEIRTMDLLLANDLFVLAPLAGYDSRNPEEKPRLAYCRTSDRHQGKTALWESWEVEFWIDRLSIFLLETAM